MGKRVSFRIRCKRRSDLALLLTLALLVTVFLGYLAWGQEKAIASSPQAPLAPFPGMRQYYLTKGLYGGANASTACASGYHMASLWEILDPSELEYNTDLGSTTDDSGAGPPASGGWVRTGYSNDNGTTAGQANCSVWSTTSGNGTTALLPSDWAGGVADIHVWDVYGTGSCSSVGRVWCVEDYYSAIYLPLVLRNYG
jgi:hypothetical protein